MSKGLEVELSQWTSWHYLSAASAHLPTSHVPPQLSSLHQQAESHQHQHHHHMSSMCHLRQNTMTAMAQSCPQTAAQMMKTTFHQTLKPPVMMKSCQTNHPASNHHRVTSGAQKLTMVSSTTKGVLTKQDRCLIKRNKGLQSKERGKRKQKGLGTNNITVYIVITLYCRWQDI